MLVGFILGGGFVQIAGLFLPDEDLHPTSSTAEKVSPSSPLRVEPVSPSAVIY